MLFTAIAGTVVILPFALQGAPLATTDRPLADQTQLVSQPLTGIGGGETIREVHQDTPFSIVALTADDLTGTSARVRAKKADGSWGPWYEAETLDGVGDGPRRTGTEPVFVGRTTTVQIAVTRPARAAASAPSSNAGRPIHWATCPANVEQPFGQNINAVLISPPQAPMDTLPLPTAVAAPVSRPTSSTAHSGAPTSRGSAGTPCTTTGCARASCTTPRAATTTAPEDSAAIVRSIYAYHTRTLGWCDIAYNALVDKYGQVFEGRAGGITRPVEGAHTGGFNANTWGVAMLGNFDVVPPTPIHSHTAGCLAGGSGWTTSTRGARSSCVGRRLVHPLPARRHPDAADDLHPPRRRQHRLPGQRRLRGDGPDPRHRCTFQRSVAPPDLAGPAARRRDPRKWESIGGRTAPSVRRRRRRLPARERALRHLRQGRGLLVDRTAERNPSPARSTARGPRWASSAVRSACRPAAKSKSRSGSCRTSSTARSTSTARRAR